MENIQAEIMALLDASDDAIIGTDLRGTVTLWNKGAERLYGYTFDEMIGRSISRVVPGDREMEPTLFRERLSRGERIDREESMRIAKDGSRIDVSISIVPVSENGGVVGAIATFRDISKRRRAERQARETEERTRELSTLLQVSHNVASTLELPSLLGTIVDELKHVVEYVDCTIMRIDDDRLCNVDYRGPLPTDEILAITVPFDLIPRLWGKLSRGEAAIIEDLRSLTPEAQEFWQAIGESNWDRYSHLRSWMGVPLSVKNRIIGLLTIMYDQPGYYTERDAQLTLAIAQHAAVAIEKAQLYERAQELAASEERSRLARELHDSVTQALFSMTMHARAAQMALERETVDRDGPLARNLAQIRDLTQGALAEMRALIFELRPGALSEEGLVAALRKHGAAVSAREELTVAVHAPDERIRLDPVAEEHLYRMAQEAIHNVVKHAGAQRVDVRLMPSDRGRLSLEIADDGIGFDPEAVPSGHLGLRTMSDRARQIGGEIEVESKPGGGTTVRVLTESAAVEAVGA